MIKELGLALKLSSGIMIMFLEHLQEEYLKAKKVKQVSEQKMVDKIVIRIY